MSASANPANCTQGYVKWFYDSRNSSSLGRHRRLYALLQYEALHGGTNGPHWFTEAVGRSRRESAVSHISRWRVLRDPRYLRFAVPGMILWGVSAAYWGQGNWPRIASFVGIALIILSLPRKPKDRTKQPGPGPSKWTGVR
jgi:hypothetical protein